MANNVTISSAIASLRSELELAAKAATNLPEDKKYSISEIEIELGLEVAVDVNANGKVGWWVVEAVAGTSKTTGTTHSVRMKLDIGEFKVGSQQSTK